jgi:hypothetical protein
VSGAVTNHGEARIEEVEAQECQGAFRRARMARREEG